jgi:hypothetical protein
MMKTLRILTIMTLTMLAVFRLTAQESDLPSGVDGAVTLQNVSTQGWRIVSVEGDGIHKGSGDATIYLEIDGRYHFDVSEIDSDQFPMDFRDPQGQILFTQDDSERDEGDSGMEGANLETDEEGVTFTLTPELAERITFFRATTYPQMVGIIAPYIQPEEGESDESNESIKTDDTE